MRLDRHQDDRTKGKEELDLFEYPASLPYRVVPPRRTLQARIAYAAIPVLAATGLLIFFVDLPLAQLLKEVSVTGIPLGDLPLFAASDWFIFSSLILTFLLNWFVHHNRVLQRQIIFVFLAVALSGTVSHILRYVFGRYPPNMLYEKGVHGFAFLELSSGEASFPASPVMLITALLVSIHMLYPRFGRAYMIAVLVVAVDCVVMRLHFLGDVVIGVYLALVITLLTRKIFERYLGRI
jgi:hypothetical protein